MFAAAGDRKYMAIGKLKAMFFYVQTVNTAIQRRKTKMAIGFKVLLNRQ